MYIKKNIALSLCLVLFSLINMVFKNNLVQWRDKKNLVCAGFLVKYLGIIGKKRRKGKYV